MLITITSRLIACPVIFGTLLFTTAFTLMGLLLKLVSDITYVIVDPRIDFESREG